MNKSKRKKKAESEFAFFLRFDLYEYGCSTERGGSQTLGNFLKHILSISTRNKISDLLVLISYCFFAIINMFRHVGNDYGENTEE